MYEENDDLHRHVLLEHTNHTLSQGPTPGPRIVFPMGDDVKPYDPTYIYRPYAEQQMY
jgi:hypothetical protein